MKIKVLFIFLLLIPLSVFALTAKMTELLGIPTADVLQNGQLDVAGYVSTALLFNEDRIPLSYNLAVSYGLLNTMDITLHMYTYQDFALQYQYNLLKGHKTFPDIAIGVKNLTYRQYVDEGGGGTDPETAGYYDYSWEERSSDLFSVYAVFTRDFGAAGKYTLGIGRGEFVGYDRGKYLSTAAFFNETDLLSGITNEFVFGFFGGAEIPIMKNLSFLTDVDGRDVNVGLKYFTELFSVSAALTHAELFTSNDPDQKPRVDVSVNYLFDFGQKKQQYGFLSINIIDNATNKLIPATVSFEGKSTKPFYLKSGKVKMKLKPGKYTIKIDAKDFKWQKRILTIAANTTNEINIALSKKYDEKQKQHDKAITLAKEAKTKLNQGDIKGALIKLEEAKKLAPNDPTVLAYWKEAQNKKKQMITTHKNNALMYEKKGWWKSAKNEWNAILVLDKNNSEAKNKYNTIDKKIKDIENPKKDTVKEKPKGDPEKLYNEGYGAFLDGNYKKAVDKFEQVLKINPNHKKAKQYLDKAKKRM